MIKVGVVGVGYLGSIHAQIYARMPEVKLVGVVDADAQRAAEIADRCHCEAMTHVDDILGKVDAVSVAVPTSMHREIALPLLDAGVHTLLEKPVAVNVADAVAINEAAKSSGCILQIGHLERFNAGVIELAQRVSEPRFVEATRLGTFVERATDVDVVTDLMIHDIDIVLSLMHSPIASVSAIGTTVVTDQIDIANARLEFDNGAVANFTASRVSAKKFRRLRVFSKDSYHGLDFVGQSLDIMRPGEARPDQRFPEIVQERVNVEGPQPLDAELAHFVSVVRNGGQPLVGGDEGIRALRVANEVHERILNAA